jgi:DNA-binding response OmpR family regulator
MATRILVVDDSPTLRKVVATILERHGFEAVVAGDGQRALELLLEAGDKPTEKFDLVLVDFVMPRMNGFQFCRSLRARPHLAQTPVILMSAKSDKIREQFVLQTGAIDAITKPFDAQALVAMIEHALMRVRAGRTPPASSAALPSSDDDDADSMRPASGVELVSQGQAHAADFVTRMARILSASLAGHPAVALPEEDHLATMLKARIPAESLAELCALAQANAPLPAEVALAGDLARVPIGAVMQLLQVEAQTGALTVRSGSSEITLLLESGLIAFVHSKGAGDEFRLGRYFVEEGLVTPQEIERLLRDATSAPPAASDVASPSAGARSSERPRDDAAVEDLWSKTSPAPPPNVARMSRPRLGDRLVESGRITDAQLREALARQSSELIYEVLRWQRGRFEFRPEPLPSHAVRLGLPVAHVVMEGFRRVDEWRLIEAKLGSFDDVLLRDPVAIEALRQGSIERSERAVLDAIDGERTVREIVRASHMSSFDACKILFQLLEARLVRRRAG